MQPRKFPAIYQGDPYGSPPLTSIELCLIVAVAIVAAAALVAGIF